MSQIANITVFDGAGTPVSHTLTAIEVTREGGKITALWREATATIPVYAQVSCRSVTEKLKSGITRTEWSTYVPVMESVSGQNAAGYTAAPKVAYIDTLTTVGYFHERSTINSRRLARQMHVNLGGNVSTSVTPVVTGPFPELFDTLTSPT